MIECQITVLVWLKTALILKMLEIIDRLPLYRSFLRQTKNPNYFTHNYEILHLILKIVFTIVVPVISKYHKLQHVLTLITQTSRTSCR